MSFSLLYRHTLCFQHTWPRLCTEGIHCKFSCYTATALLVPSVLFAARAHNFDSTSRLYLLISSITTVLSMAMCTASELHVSKVASFLQERERGKKRTKYRAVHKGKVLAEKNFHFFPYSFHKTRYWTREDTGSHSLCQSQPLSVEFTASIRSLQWGKCCREKECL